MIQDPGAGLATRELRRAARTIWKTQWSNLNASKKKTYLWNAFKDFYFSLSQRKKLRLIDKIRILMNDPYAELNEMATFVKDKITARNLRQTMSWLS